MARAHLAAQRDRPAPKPSQLSAGLLAGPSAGRQLAREQPVSWLMTSSVALAMQNAASHRWRRRRPLRRRRRRRCRGPSAGRLDGQAIEKLAAAFRQRPSASRQLERYSHLAARLCPRPFVGAHRRARYGSCAQWTPAGGKFSMQRPIGEFNSRPELKSRAGNENAMYRRRRQRAGRVEPAPNLLDASARGCQPISARMRSHLEGSRSIWLADCICELRVCSFADGT